MDISVTKKVLKKWFVTIFYLFAPLLAFVCQAENVNLDSLDIPLPRKEINEQILRRTGYTVSYNADLRIPNWVAWRLTADHVKGTTIRPGGNAWHEDDEVACPRATGEDYRNSGWSRGHMCPAGDCKWDDQVMYESFLYTNCCPQDRSFNSGDWNEIEIRCRRWAEKYGDIYIVCGPILYNQEHRTIGQNRIVVPEAFFKVVLCFINGKPEGIGFICKNENEGKLVSSYVNTIHEVERITGYTFFPSLPAEWEDSAKGMISSLLK